MDLLEIAELTVKWKHYRDVYRRLFETTGKIDEYNAKIADWQQFIKECRNTSELELKIKGGIMENFNGHPIDYIGDGVYVLFDGYGFELRANDHANPTDTIFIEPAVLEALNNFASRFLKAVS